MTKAQAKTVVADLIEAGLEPTIRQNSATDYTVKVAASAAITTVHNFADNHSVSATVMGVEFN